jgi:hypothetical protein
MEFKEQPKYSNLKDLFVIGPMKIFRIKNMQFNDILNEFDLDKPCNKLIEKLINHNYYVEDLGNEYYREFVPEEYSFGGETKYNNIPYRVNVDFFAEVYAYLKSIIEDLYDRNFTKDIFSITLNLEACLNNSMKIDLLKECLKECYNVDSEEAEDFLMYLKDGSDVWEDNITGWIPFEDEIYMYYLKSTPLEKLNNSNILDRYLPQWFEFYRREKLISFCKNKINELETLDKSNNSSYNVKYPSNLKNLIFKEDGAEMYNYINSSYSGKKDRAFYSYIYSFLQSKSKLIDNFKKDLKYYRDFVLEDSEFNTFPKIINSNADKQEKKKAMFLAFENIIKSYSVYSEEIKNKSE